MMQTMTFLEFLDRTYGEIGTENRDLYELKKTKAEISRKKSSDLAELIEHFANNNIVENMFDMSDLGRTIGLKLTKNEIEDLINGLKSVISDNLYKI